MLFFTINVFLILKYNLKIKMVSIWDYDKTCSLKKIIIPPKIALIQEKLLKTFSFINSSKTALCFNIKVKKNQYIIRLLKLKYASYMYFF